MSKRGSDNKLLTFSILIAAVMISGAVAWSNLRGTPVVPALTPLGPYDEQIIVSEEMQACAQGDKCIVVDTTCSFCCKYVAVNAKHEQDFNKMFDGSCSRYNGAMCECFDLSSFPSCIDGKCQLMKWDEDEQKSKSKTQEPQP